MTASLVLLALALHAAPADPLAPARDALEAGDYARAETLALAAARPPRAGAALYVAGLARFRAGRPRAALEALDAAARAADPPARGLWLFNRGACLYALGRFGEAEAAFVAAADAEPSLAAVARADAGFAALDGGALARARDLARSARAVASGGALALVEQLEAALAAQAAPDSPAGQRARAAAAYRDALAAFDAGRFAEARRGFRRAATLDPADGRAPLMAGAAALRLGARAEARADLVLALGRRLDGPAARIARAYLAEASYGLASRPEGWALSVHAGAGWDDNVLQSGGSGPELSPLATPHVRSALALAGGSVARRWRPGPAVAVDVGYGVDQSAFAAAAARDYGLQQHVATAALELTAAPRLRVGALASGEATFTGVGARFRALDAGPGAGAWVAVDASDAATTRVDLAASHRGSPRREFRYLAGDRLDVAVAERLRLGRVTLDASWRHRVERLGTLEVQAAPPPPGSCGATLPCPSGWVIPFASTADVVTLGASATIGRVRLAAAAGHAWRRFHADAVTTGLDGSGATVLLGRRRRRDARAFGGVAASVRVLRRLALTARWDVVANASTIARGEPGHDLDYADARYTKQVVLLDAALAW